VTRGVNKGVKEDFKVALEKQVSRCNENIESIIRSFLAEEIETLQSNLL
jgi:integrator complex subunit 10